LRPASDINLLFVLRRFDAAQADLLREPFRVAQAAANVNAMFVLAEELPDAAQEFAQKFADIMRRHVVLHGPDAVAALAIPRDALVRRVRQVLLNLTIRLRETYLARSLRDEQSAATLADVAGPLRTAAAAILELEGRGPLPPKEALAALVDDFGRDDFRELLPHLSEAREQRALPAGRAAELFFATLELTRALHERATKL
jgi:hypothetical protein